MQEGPMCPLFPINYLLPFQRELVFGVCVSSNFNLFIIVCIILVLVIRL